MKIYRIVVTPGEPAGIGPDLIIKLAQYNWPVEIVVCADKLLLQERASLLGLPLELLPYNPKNQPIKQRAGTLTLLSIPLYTPVIPGKLNIKNSYYVIDTLLRACNGCQSSEFAALITGPVHKGIINDAGISFTGHTEFLKEYTQSQKVVMMFVTKKLRIALATTHLPLRKVSTTLTIDLLRDIITILNYELNIKFGIKMPHILVCGLNPHSGEGGYIGNEEINIIIPVLKELKERGICLSGPLSADTIFQAKHINNADVILTMYHDQGLPIIKCCNFGYGVNVTLGLPFIRTSVDHGTALNLAGFRSYKADIGSFFTTINFTIEMIIKLNE